MPSFRGRKVHTMLGKVEMPKTLVSVQDQGRVGEERRPEYFIIEVSWEPRTRISCRPCNSVINLQYARRHFPARSPEYKGHGFFISTDQFKAYFLGLGI